ncbi:phosphoenolpyruvate carboxylase [Xanthocytophaga flava]|uniref:phosphoenolpyruvate carboxylase n=1 Tax=Xanthocytophaga flava TaxID=3048013 RepID=UPI0028D354D6|nr:phosphoenolpyruvate carboxylase [Xanthocytophaga flavus]MDJ1470947.1 phosphoenolpyruvate carboxylase [Xanthocytophaga flavus]
MNDQYQNAVVTRYNIFNSLFLSLPFRNIFRTGTLLPLLIQQSEEGLTKEQSPKEIIEHFFDEFLEGSSHKEQISLLFNFIQYIERQVVLFDSVEDAAFDQIHDREGKGSINHLLNRIDNTAIREKLLEKLSDYCVRIVLTAHPTQFYPGKVLTIINELERAIRSNDFGEINNLLLQLGKTGFINQEKPTPFDEAVSLSWFLESVFYYAIPRILLKLIRGLRFSVYDWPHNQLIRLGFWPGGDRDGNPFVTPDITLKVSQHLRRTVLRCYYRDLRLLKRRFTFNGVERLIALAEEKINNSIYYPEEEKYNSAEELLADLSEARQILIHQHDGLFLDLLDEFIFKVRLFGFYFASLDVRQDSRKHAAAWNELIAAQGKLKEYEQLSEAQKIDYLLSLQITPKPEDVKDETSKDIIGSIRTIQEIQQLNGEAGCHRYVISNCNTALNVIEVLSLIKTIHQTDSIPVDIVPLFETVGDLANAGGIMEFLYQHPYYRQHLTNRGNQQTIMVGFSDGTKDGGYLRANWSIYQAKEELTRMSRQYGIKVTFFDGRGGPPGRGGGNNHNFYASLGKGIEDKEIQLTIQGQTISSNYGTVATAMHNLGKLFTAGLENHLFKDTEQDLSDEEKGLLEEMAEISYHSYLDLKNHPTFVPYLDKMTPLRFYGQTNIGSRPTKRGQGDALRFEDLRAIPFVGSWAQMKQNVPGFYGFGTAIEKLKKEGKTEAMLKLYEHSLFFRTLIENSMQSLSKSNYAVTKYMADDPTYGELWHKMEEEFQRTHNLLLEISQSSTLLESNPITRQSITVRERVVLPLIIIQQYALQMLNTDTTKSTEQTEAYNKLIIRAMFGIINAARNSA